MFFLSISWYKGKGRLDKSAPVDFSGTVAGGWADGGCWRESENIHNLNPYVYNTYTQFTF